MTAKSRFRLLFLLACAGCRMSTGGDAGADGAPIRGGTLRILGNADVDHLSTSSAYVLPAFALMRAYTRQLVSYAPSADWSEHVRSAADLARELPTRENGGISADGKTYTFHLRTGVRWNTSPARGLVAGDVVRGMAMLCNPVSPVPAPGYFRSTIAGMGEHCDAFAQVEGSVPAIRAFASARAPSGVRAPDDSTVVFTLLEPASDFLQILALPFASPVPAEYLEYLPDSPAFRQHTISLGPYQIVSYVPGREYRLARSPAWDAAADPLRPAYVDSIHVTLGVSAQSVQQQLEAGIGDLSFDQDPPTADLAALLQMKDPKLVLAPPADAFSGLYYMPVNELSPNQDGALRKVGVRRALEYAVDRAAISQVRGGPELSRPLHQAVTSAAAGYAPGYDPYPSPGDHGDPEQARRLLAEAGYPNGLELKLLYQTRTFWPDMAQTVQASLERAGIRTELVPATGSDFYAKYLRNPENGARGVWDIALANWVPDWYGNNGRTVIAALFDGRTRGRSSVNYSSYDNPDVNAAIDRALTAASDAEAMAAWQDAARRVIEDAAIVPLNEGKQADYHSPRLRHCTIHSLSLYCDFTAVWLGR